VFTSKLITCILLYHDNDIMFIHYTVARSASCYRYNNKHTPTHTHTRETRFGTGAKFRFWEIHARDSIKRWPLTNTRAYCNVISLFFFRRAIKIRIILYYAVRPSARSIHFVTFLYT